MKKALFLVATVAALGALTQTPVFGQLAVTEGGLSHANPSTVGFPTPYTIDQYENNDGRPTNIAGVSQRNTSGSGGITQIFNISPSDTTTGVGDTYDTLADITSIDIVSKSNATPTSWTLTIGADDDGTIENVQSFTLNPSSVVVGTQHYVQLTFVPGDYVALPAGQYFFNITTTGPGIIASSVNSSTVAGTGYGSAATVSGLADGDTITPATTGGSYTFFIDTVPVPEPAEWALVPMLAALAFFGLRRFNRQPLLA